MIPEDIEQFTTPGEGRVYHFLAAAARPDNEYIIWYSPDIKGREPNFVLFNDDVGLVIFLNISQADKFFSHALIITQSGKMFFPK